MTEMDSTLNEQLQLTKELMQIVCGKNSFFKHCRDLFDGYWKQLQKKRPDLITQKINDFSCEALSRLSQLDFLLEKIKALETLMEEKRQHSILNGMPMESWLQKSNQQENEMPDANVVREIISRLNDTSILEIELYTECFYYIAHRLKKIIQYYPNLKDFNPIGIISVRNNLIEHPHGKNGITTPSFGFGNSNGPIVKAGRVASEANKSVDDGLYKNAEEFRHLLEEVLINGFQLLDNSKP